jgi:hypothetical protein
MGTIKIKRTSKGKERFKARVKVQGEDIRKSFHTEQEAQAWIEHMEASKPPPRPRQPKAIHPCKRDKERCTAQAFASALGIPALTMEYMLYYRKINGLAACGAITRLSKPRGTEVIIESLMLNWLKEKNLWRECEGSGASSYNDTSEGCSCEELYDQNQFIANPDSAVDNQAAGQEAPVAFRAED